MKIDLNCDMGENIGNEEEIMPYITSANIACGFHAGNEMSMRSTVRLAKRYGVAIGAHPAWKDKEGFGRREMSLSSEEVEALESVSKFAYCWLGLPNPSLKAGKCLGICRIWQSVKATMDFQNTLLVLYQIGALHAIAKAEGLELRHVKPHGALYNQAAKDQMLANVIAGAVKLFSPDLILVGLAGSGFIEVGIETGLRVAREGFPDRNYNFDGTLVSRRQANALIKPPEEVALHALKLAQEGIDFSGRRVRLDTLCLHGDHPHAAQNAKTVHDRLEESGIEIVAL